MNPRIVVVKDNFDATCWNSERTAVGQPDLFGRQLQTSELGVADEVAAAASLVMGQAGEGRPIVLARGVPYERREGSINELIRPRQMDLFR